MLQIPFTLLGEKNQMPKIILSNILFNSIFTVLKYRAMSPHIFMVNTKVSKPALFADLSHVALNKYSQNF
jgi:hypothetical protein